MPLVFHARCKESLETDHDNSVVMRFEAELSHLEPLHHLLTHSVGVKPCVLFAMNHEIEMTRDLVAAAMQPVMEAHQVESKGFILQEIRCAGAELGRRHLHPTNPAPLLYNVHAGRCLPCRVQAGCRLRAYSWLHRLLMQAPAAD